MQPKLHRFVTLTRMSVTSRPKASTSMSPHRKVESREKDGADIERLRSKRTPSVPSLVALLRFRMFLYEGLVSGNQPSTSEFDWTRFFQPLGLWRLVSAEVRTWKTRQ